MNVFFTDLDETLLTSDKKVSPATMNALHSFCEAGNLFALNSGRNLGSVLSVKEQCSLNFPNMLAVAYNGGLIYECDTEMTIRELRLKREIVSTIFEEAKRFHIHCQTYTDTALICESENAETQFYKQYLKHPILTDPNPMKFVHEDPYKVLCINLEDKSKLEVFRAHIEAMFPNQITAFFSNPFFLEFININSGKGEALRYVCEAKKIPLSHSYAAGDAENDISMLLAAGTSVAMINGSPEVKKAATIITQRDNNHDGLVDFIHSIT